MYRWDGACRGQGATGRRVAGAGIVYFGNGPQPLAWFCKFLGEGLTNNIAEYEGSIAALERIEREGHDNTVLEGDSMLVANQISGKFAVRTEALKLYWRVAHGIIERLQARGLKLQVRHIYREFNEDADGQANRGADGVTAQFGW